MRNYRKSLPGRIPVATINPMKLEFDAAKDAENIKVRGLSFARAVEMREIVVVPDDRFAERRFRLYGFIDEKPHCAAVTLRGDAVRVISLRRAHWKEFRRYG